MNPADCYKTMLQLESQRRVATDEANRAAFDVSEVEQRIWNAEARAIRLIKLAVVYRRRSNESDPCGDAVLALNKMSRGKLYFMLFFLLCVSLRYVY